MLDCIIIGAGPAGMAAARALAGSGLKFKILEAADSVGGRTKTVAKPGYILDLGAAFMTSFYKTTLGLCRNAGVELATPGLHPGRSHRAHHLLIKGEFIPHRIGSLSGFLQFPYIPIIQKLRTIWTASRLFADAGLHVSDIESLAARDVRNACEWGQSALGQDAWEYVVRLSFEPFFFYEAKEVSQAFVQALLRHSVSWRLFAPQNGMGDFCTSLARDLPVVTGAKVSKIFETCGSLTVVHSLGAESTRTAIIAIAPPDVLHMDIPLNFQDVNDIRAVRYAPSVRVNFGYHRTCVLKPPVITTAGPGSHTVVGIAEQSRWMPLRVPEGQEIVRVSATANRSEQLVNCSTTQIPAALLSDCRSLGVYLPEPDWSEVIIHPNAIVKTPPGHFKRARAFLRRDRERIFFAGDWLTGSTIEGAVRTGLAAAKAVKNKFGTS